MALKNDYLLSGRFQVRESDDLDNTYPLLILPEVGPPFCIPAPDLDPEPRVNKHNQKKKTLQN